VMEDRGWEGEGLWKVRKENWWWEKPKKEKGTNRTASNAGHWTGLPWQRYDRHSLVIIIHKVENRLAALPW
jgi:hypothetical protein